jgi:prepilin-type N-terminal cleavage/methylation domain-containing protein
MKNHRRFAQASRNKREHQPMRRRQGFTLVELLVAMALIIFIMAILSQAFVSATSTFRSLKASGDMAEKLRATTGLLQRDLAADHFEGKKRLSNPNFWLYGPPEQGFVQIYQINAGTLEGNDLDSIGSYRTITHALAFSIKVRGNNMGDFLTAGSAGGILLGNLTTFGPNEARYQSPVGATSYSYQWGEVAWFLRPQINPATAQQDTTATDTATGSAGVPLYTLYRRQRLAVPDNSVVPTQTYAGLPQAQVLELSCWQNGANWHFNNPMDLTVPGRRFGGGNPANFTTIATELGTYSNPLAGSDIQLTDVVSFDVRLLVSGITVPGSADHFVTLLTPVNPQLPVNLQTNPPLFLSYGNPNQQQNPGQAYNPGYNFLTGPMVFDTWSSVNDGLSNYSQWNVTGTATSIPLWNGARGPIILAIQVSVRIWDLKTNQTRQVTIVQAM